MSLQGTLQVVVNILVQRTTPWGSVKSRLARWLHNILIIEMLVESHTSSEWPQLARRLCAGVAGHRQHHRSASLSDRNAAPDANRQICMSLALADSTSARLTATLLRPCA